MELRGKEHFPEINALARRTPHNGAFEPKGLSASLANPSDDPPDANKNPGAAGTATGAYEMPLAGQPQDTAEGAAAQRVWSIRVRCLVADLVDHLADAPLWAVRATLGALVDGVEDATGETVRDVLHRSVPVSPVDLMTRDELRRGIVAIWKALPQEDRIAFVERVTRRAA